MNCTLAEAGLMRFVWISTSFQKIVPITIDLMFPSSFDICLILRVHSNPYIGH